MATILRLDRVGWRTVEGHQIFRGISFSVEQGELLALVGPSGAGKSSLLRMLNRLDDPTEGEIYFLDRPFGAWPVRELRRRIGLVMQGGIMLPGSVADNVCAGPQLHRRSCEGERLLDWVGLPRSAWSRGADELSGGERQRVALARALANDPDVLLLDEPTASLDPRSRQEIGRLIREGLPAVRTRPLTTLWVTHFMEEAEHADRVAVLAEGELKALGPWSAVAASLSLWAVEEGEDAE